MGLTIDQYSSPLGYRIKDNTCNSLENKITSLFNPGYYQDITSKDGFFDKIQKSWENTSAYMPESGKRGMDLLSAKVHNFFAALSYVENNPLGLWKFYNMSKLDHCRLG